MLSSKRLAIVGGASIIASHMPFNPVSTEYLHLVVCACVPKLKMEGRKEDNSLPLPTVEAVLDKVKSDGTFDQFRKTCLAAVEAEVYMESTVPVSQHILSGPL